MAERIKLPRDEPRPERDEKPPRNQPPPRGATTSDAGDGKGGAASRPAASSRPRSRAGTADARITESLVGLYGMVGAGVSAVGTVQQNAGLVAAGVNVTVQAESLAEAWIQASKESPAIRRTLEAMLKGGAITILVTSHVGIIAPLLAAGGVLPQQVGNMFLSSEAVDAGMTFQANVQAAQAAAQAAQQGNGGGGR